MNPESIALGAPEGISQASFRDPAGSLFLLNQKIYRIVNAAGAGDLKAFLASSAAQKFIGDGHVVATRTLDGEELGALLANPDVEKLYAATAGQMAVEHERIWFPSFPYEWPAEMLHAAGALTLDLAEALIPDGIGLKDATPYNVLYRGTEPVFIDALSFEQRQSGDPTWLPYGQFVRTFLLPLLVTQRMGLGLDQILTTRRDGLEPEEVYRLAGPLRRLGAPFLSLVSIPTWLGSRRGPDDQAIYQKKTLDDSEKAQFILGAVLKGLRHKLDRTAPRAGKSSNWSDYMVSNNYSAEHFSAKEKFVTEALAASAPRRVLDVGCNTGHFSAIAARGGAAVVAIDYDPVVVGGLWRKARAEKLNILPLAVNLTRPTPGSGWRNSENASFLDRARGSFDAVVMLAVIHHMLVTERIPLPEILDLAAELTTGVLIVEFIGPEDSMFQRLTRGREALHQGLNHEMFESLCQRQFEIVKTHHAEGSHRWLYLLRKRS